MTAQIDKKELCKTWPYLKYSKADHPKTIKGIEANNYRKWEICKPRNRSAKVR